MSAVKSDVTALMQLARMSSTTLATQQTQVAQALQKLATDLTTLAGDANLSAPTKAALALVLAQVQQAAQNAQQK